MKKALIFTLPGNFNFGSKLQSYALERLLERMGLYAETAALPERILPLSEKIKTPLRKIIFNAPLSGKKGRIYRACTEREELFRKFTDEHLKMSREIDICDGTVRLPLKRYDLFLTGSDQVWHNWHRYDRGKISDLRLFYLMDIPREKRIAYAPSFGYTQLPREETELHRAGLSGFDDGRLSVRERDGAELIKELTGRTVPIVPDPTLMISRGDWEGLMKKPSYPLPKKFTLVCFLGQKPHLYSEEPQIDILDREKLYFRKTGPQEFLWLIASCEKVLTDSFHACVFSMLFHKSFNVFRRRGSGFEDMFGRIEGLLSGTGLEKNIGGKSEPSADFTQSDEEINRRRSIGESFIERAVSA